MHSVFIKWIIREWSWCKPKYKKTFYINHIGFISLSWFFDKYLFIIITVGEGNVIWCLFTSVNFFYVIFLFTELFCALLHRNCFWKKVIIYRDDCFINLLILAWCEIVDKYFQLANFVTNNTCKLNKKGRLNLRNVVEDSLHYRHVHHRRLLFFGGWNFD